jgi:hypothetical protein
MKNTAARQSERPAPRTIVVPDVMEKDLEELVERTARRLGERPEQTRRAVEIAVLSRGMAAIRKDEGGR